MVELAQGRATWAIPWPCIHEFLAVVTHVRVYRPPSTLKQSLQQVEAWMEAPTLQLLHESHDHFETLSDVLEKARVSGPLVHDARVAAICLVNGVRELWTADRDFARFPRLRTRNPLIERRPDP